MLSKYMMMMGENVRKYTAWPTDARKCTKLTRIDNEYDKNHPSSQEKIVYNQ